MPLAPCARPSGNAILTRPRIALALASMAGAAMLTAGCTPASLVIGAGARTGLAAFDERGIGGTVNDTALQLAVDAALLDEGGDLFWSISTLVRNGRVLLVGNVPSEADRAAAVARAGGVADVAEVLDALQVGPRPQLNDDAQDTLITQRVTYALVFDSEVKAVNYGVLTHNAVVYLMGSARSQWELDRVIDHVRNVTYVRGVVSHVQVIPEDADEAIQG